MDLKLKQNLTREDITNLLKSIGKPGENRDKKIIAVAELNKQNFQQVKLEDSLESYEAF